MAKKGEFIGTEITVEGFCEVLHLHIDLGQQKAQENKY